MMDNTVGDKFDELRKLLTSSPLDIARWAHGHQIQLSPGDIWQISSRLYCSPEHLGPHPFVTAFIARLLADICARSILDVWAGIGAAIIPVTRDRQAEVAIALERNPDSLETGRLLSEDLSIDWRLCDPDQELGALDGPFDVVIGVGPIGMARRSAKFEVAGRSVTVRDDANHLTMLRAAQLLAPDGIGVFLAAPSFSWSRDEHRVVANLTEFGLHVDAVLSLPPGSLAGSSIGSNLVIIRRQRRDSLFVAELSEATDCDVLLSNLRKRREGRIPEYGLLTTMADFGSFESLRAQREILRLAKRLGYPPTPLESIATAVKLTKSRRADGFEDLPNCVYLPLIGVRDACTSPTDLEIKAHNYAQIVLDPAKAEARYIAGFLNTPLGRMIRQSLVSGAYIPKLSKTSLSEAVVFIPRDVEEQRKVIEAEANISDLREQLNSYRRDLWSQPRRAPEITRAVEAMRPDNSLAAWMEQLPYPLATVLWAYHTKIGAQEQELRLSQFFEALAEFNVTLMLSALSSDIQFYRSHCEEWWDGDTEHRGWYKKASFGNWVAMGTRLAKVIRRMMSQDQDGSRDLCSRLFGNPAPGFLAMLTDKRLYNDILERAVYHRNTWIGHGGYRGDKHYEEGLRILEIELIHTREIVSDWYTHVLFLRPGDNRKRDGIYNYGAELLMGRSYPFRHVKVRTEASMEDEQLYMLPKDRLSPKRLLPFLRLAGSPSDAPNACYFYNRVDPDGARYVSYQFAEEPDIRFPSEEIDKEFEVLIQGER